jgi:hypothetical protein
VDEVVQLYIHYTQQSILHPSIKEMKGFARVQLQAVSSRAPDLYASTPATGVLSGNLQFVLNPGKVEVLIGSSAEDIRLRRICYQWQISAFSREKGLFLRCRCEQIRSQIQQPGFSKRPVCL